MKIVPEILRDDKQDFYPLTENVVVFFGAYSMHTPLELHAISEVLRVHRPTRIVEYGTGHGGLTLGFGQWAYLNDAKVLSIENHFYTTNEGMERFFSLFEKLPVELLDANEYHQETYNRIQTFAENEKTFFYCDGGNKPVEVRCCAQILKPDDLLVTHDYFPIEPPRGAINLPDFLVDSAYVLPRQIERWCSDFDLEKVYEEFLGREENGMRALKVLALRKRATEVGSGSVAPPEPLRDALEETLV
jgi:hypothetical protein